MLFTALNKYYRPLSRKEYSLMTIEEIENAVAISGMPQGVVDKIWVKKRTAFEVF